MTSQVEVTQDGKREFADRFEWAAPGDQQEDAWLVRFCDKDCGEAVFTGPDAERDAWEHWNRYAPAFNIYVFRLARLTAEQAKDAEIAELRAHIAEQIEHVEARIQDGIEMGATVWRIALEDVARENRTIIAKQGEGNA